jgi:hypothetical protein
MYVEKKWINDFYPNDKISPYLATLHVEKNG